MTGQVSEPDTLTLHAVRLLGYGETQRIAGRFDQDPLEVEERLLDFESVGWVSRSSFADSSGWSLTDLGRSEDERRLSDELDERGARAVVVDVHARFLPLNGRFQDVATRWQIRPMPGDPMAANDHSDHRWDDRVLDSLASIARRLAPLVEELAGELTRFADYSRRFDAAVARAMRGERSWVDGVGMDSCHTVWMQLHEDLLATLGLDRVRELG